MMTQETIDAQEDLLLWRALALTDMARGREIASLHSSHIPDELRIRIHRALQGCTTPEEVDLVFAQVQATQGV